MTQIVQIVGSIGHLGQVLEYKSRPGPIAVVNACNPTLSTGGGVTGALVEAVGGACSWYTLMKTARNSSGQPAPKVLETAEVVYTDTKGRLQQDNIDYMIHALGPVCGYHDLELIVVTITNVLTLADQLKIKTLVLPAISGGIFAQGDVTWPKQIRQLILNTLDQVKTQIEYIYVISYSLEDQKLWL